MSDGVILIKTDQGLSFATEGDRSKLSKFKVGQGIRVDVKRQSTRSLEFHGLYWAGLIAITLDYWEPSKGMTTEAEHKLISEFCGALDRMSGGADIQKWGDEFLTVLGQNRAEKFTFPEKTPQDLHNWIKEKAGYFDVIQTPSGITRKLHSINFNSMGEEDFREFYDKAFSVCWRYVLSLNFSDENEVNNAVNNLLSVR